MAEQGETYTSLPRPRKLPPPIFGLRQDKKEALKAFMAIWNGDFRLHWKITSQPCVFLAAELLPDESSGAIADRFTGGRLILLQLEPSPLKDMIIMKGGHSKDISGAEEFGVSQKESVMNKLKSRLIYHFIRSRL